MSEATRFPSSLGPAVTVRNYRHAADCVVGMRAGWETWSFCPHRHRLKPQEEAVGVIERQTSSRQAWRGEARQVGWPAIAAEFRSAEAVRWGGTCRCRRGPWHMEAVWVGSRAFLEEKIGGWRATDVEGVEATCRGGSRVKTSSKGRRRCLSQSDSPRRVHGNNSAVESIKRGRATAELEISRAGVQRSRPAKPKT